MKSRYGKVAVLLAVILAVSTLLTVLLGRYPKPQTEELSVVAAFYPMYTAALQVVGKTNGVSVSCLTAPGAGCLHDYQLSPVERAQLDAADVLVLNGGGMESFLNAVIPSIPSLFCIDTTTDVSLLCGDAHEHDHDHDHAVNAHAWIDPVRYAAQVQAICDGLCEVDPAHAESYRHNTAAYLQKVQTVAAQLTATDITVDGAVLFHESMAYVAECLGLRELAQLPIGEETAASAGELAQVAQALRGQAVLFLYDDQYPLQYTSLTAHAETAAVVRWNTAVVPQNGVADEDAWLYAMQRNIQTLKEVLS